uniref:Zinc knuckle CX2CX4HX4C n=1 Tax=Tanacetum cinerariifolium TaxID=118510 RepID=A0A6L2NRH5_TANCI|nr:hypothetical protein [Tanacetum cinerariifolium]
MERGFLSPKDKGDRRRVKKKVGGSSTGSGFVFDSDPKLGDDTRSLRTDGNKDGSVPSIGNTQEKNVGQSSTSPTPSSYANVDGKPNRTKVNFCTLFTQAGNGIDVGRSNYVKAMIKLRADVELKDNIMVAMPKITREGYYTCNIHVEYEWKPPRCACCKVFSHVQEECPKNIGTGETKNLKKSSQTSKGIKSLLEQWKESYENDDYEYDTYDNDMYEG